MSDNYMRHCHAQKSLSGNDVLQKVATSSKQVESHTLLSANQRKLA